MSLRGETRICGFYTNGDPDRARAILAGEDGMTDFEVHEKDLPKFFEKKKNAKFFTLEEAEEAFKQGLLRPPREERRRGKPIELVDPYGAAFSRDLQQKRFNQQKKERANP